MKSKIRYTDNAWQLIAEPEPFPRTYGPHDMSYDDDFEPEEDVTEDVFDFMTREREEDDDAFASA